MSESRRYAPFAPDAAGVSLPSRGRPMRDILRARRTVAAVAAAVLGLTLAVTGAAPAQADTAPPDPALPETVAADGLPTVQIDGVVWDQAIAGNRVYAVGSFT